MIEESDQIPPNREPDPGLLFLRMLRTASLRPQFFVPLVVDRFPATRRFLCVTVPVRIRKGLDFMV